MTKRLTGERVERVDIKRVNARKASWEMPRSHALPCDTAEVRFLPCGHLDFFSQRLPHKMMNSRAVFIARIHVW